MYWYHYNYTVHFLMLINFQYFIQYIILKITINVVAFRLLKCRTACHKTRLH